MKPKSSQHDEADLFRSQLDQILDRQHPLFVLAGRIDWAAFDKTFGSLYSEKGRPGKPTRLLVGLHYLKHAFGESDESVVARLLENPYWQFFCGFEFFIHHLPIDPSSLTRWRKRIGPQGLEQLLSETLETAKREEYLTEKHMERVNVDTTVQEKAIAYPTDARLYHKARVLLVKAAKDRGIPLRQSCLQVGKRALIMSGRYSHAWQMNRAKRERKKLKNFLGRVYRNILRNCPQPDAQLAELLHNDPFDGHTLKEALKQAKRLVGWNAQNAYCDKGYKGNPKQLDGTAVHLANRRKSSMKPSEWRWFKRRSAIEPVIGHMKQDNRMDRNYLKETDGDKMNAILAGCGFNLRKLLRAFLWLVFKELCWLKSRILSLRISPEMSGATR